MKVNSNKTGIERYLIFICLILFSLIITPLGFYIENFRNYPVSDNSSDWGTLGDFFGGIANPIIGFANVLVLVYLTLKISEIDNENKFKEQENRKNEGLDEIRLMGFKELNSFVMRLVKILAKEDTIKREKVIGLKFEFHGIILPYIDLFNTFNDLTRINSLGDELLNLEITIETNEVKSKIIGDFARLLSDLRLEIKKITNS